jgi:hypothetical protein
VSLTLNSLANDPHYITVRVRGSLPTAWDWSLDDSTYTAPSSLEAIDGDWTLYGLSLPTAQATGSTTLYIRQNGAGSGDFYLDGVQVEQKGYWTTYCDGTQPGCEWLGPEHAATSQRSANSRAGGREQDLDDDYSLNVSGMTGTGTAPQELAVDSYAILPGGELNNIKTASRSFTLTGTITGTSQSDFHSIKQALIDVLSPDTYPPDADGFQPVRLRYQGATVHKEIAAHYESGLEGQISATEPCFWERVAIRFEAPNPYWSEIGESAVALDTNDNITLRNVAGRLWTVPASYSFPALVWNPLGPPASVGSPAIVWALAEDATYLYIGGNFSNFDGIANADYIVRFNKQTGLYSSLGSGMNSTVEGLLVGPDGTLYAAGGFTTAGGGGANRIASWDGSSWSALGSGLNNTARALGIGLDGTLYAGGNFTTAGGGGANYIASWDGSSWSALGSGLNNSIIATRGLTISPDGTLYAGGSFTTAGGEAANYIASWDGSSWSALGSGMNGNVETLAVGPDGILYAGGEFTTAGGISLTDRVARWNGSSWAHLDLQFAGTPFVYGILPGLSRDPIVERNYNLWLGFTSTPSQSTFAGKVTATNDGTAPAFPVAVYDRSGGTTAVVETLRNETTGLELLFDYSLLDGERLTIDLAPTKKSITSSMFGSRQDAILANSDFGDWSLLPGDNSVTSFVDESGTPTLVTYLLWKDQYKSQD